MGSKPRDGKRGKEAGTPVRLQKYLADAGLCSRRKAEELIRAGRVRVDDKIVNEMGLKVVPGEHRVFVDGREVALPKSHTYIALNKPKGYLSTVKDPFGRPTIMDLIPKGRERLYPVGRLDFDSEGLVLMTDNGALTYRLLHPSHKVPKKYLVTIKGRLSKKDISILESGVELDGRKTQPCKVKPIGRTRGKSVVEVELKEGRKRQIRRMFEKVGHPVLRLKRVKIGPLELGKLGAGKWRHLSNEEVRALKEAAGLL